MKRLLAFAVALMAFAAVANAQPKAFGVRMGYADGASYQHWLGNNFLEADASFWIGLGFNASVIYDLRFPINNQFAFYVGPGVNALFASKFYFGAAGQVGVEWEIPQVPLNVSLDWMPVYYFGLQKFSYNGAALGIRYRF